MRCKITRKEALKWFNWRTRRKIKKYEKYKRKHPEYKKKWDNFVDNIDNLIAEGLE